VIVVTVAEYDDEMNRGLDVTIPVAPSAFDDPAALGKYVCRVWAHAKEERGAHD
jgi:hypothetical protein